MADLWVLAFLVRGVIASAGDTITLTECEQRARVMPPEATRAVCINAQQPMCRVYLNDHPLTREHSAWCRQRALRHKGRSNG